MADRRAEIEAKRAKLVELRKARQMRQQESNERRLSDVSTVITVYACYLTESIRVQDRRKSLYTAERGKISTNLLMVLLRKVTMQHQHPLYLGHLREHMQPCRPSYHLLVEEQVE